MIRFRLVIILFFAVACIASAKTPNEILSEMKTKISSQNSISYSCSFRYKSLSKDDTIAFKGMAAMLRDAKDTIIGGKLGYATDLPEELGVIRIYDLENIYKADPKTKSAIKYFPHKGQDWALMPSNAAYSVYTEFFHPESITKNNLRAEMLADTIISGDECFHIIFKGTTTAGDLENHLIVSKSKMFPLLIQNFVSVDGLFSFKEFRYYDIEFNKIKDDDFNAKIQLADCTIKDYDEKDAPDAKPELLSVGTKAPTIEGKNYQNDLKNSQIDFIGKVTVLDFWYMNCPWCVKAFPEIEKLLDKFPKDKFQIVGINSRDNNDKGLARLPKFLKRIPMRYETILVPAQLPEAYHISGWPTFYIIDSKGNVAGTFIGYEEDMEKTLSDMISKLLK